MKINKWILLFTFCLITFSSLSRETSFFDLSHSFFATYVKEGLVNYQEIKTDPSILNLLMTDIAKFDLTNKDKDTQLAFYINTYNISVIQNIVSHYPLSSPLDRKGFFKSDTFLIAGKKMTLDHLENKIIRPTFKDPRVHFVLVCGALGCPPIINESYRPHNVQNLLTRQTSKALNNPKFTIENKNEIQLTEIFKWYKQDFGKDTFETIAFINTYKTHKLPSTIQLTYYTYDWTLNDWK